MEAVTFGLTKGAPFPITITGIPYNALIDTGVSHSFISKKILSTASPSPNRASSLYFCNSASGNTLCPLVICNYPIHLGGRLFEFNFFVCNVFLDILFWDGTFGKNIILV